MITVENGGEVSELDKAQFIFSQNAASPDSVRYTAFHGCAFVFDTMYLSDGWAL